jgi:hypothetical protein
VFETAKLSLSPSSFLLLGIWSSRLPKLADNLPKNLSKTYVLSKYLGKSIQVESAKQRFTKNNTNVVANIFLQ